MNVQPFRRYVFAFAVSVSLVVPFTSSSAAGATVSYAGQQVVQVTARTAEEAELIHNLNLDIWSCFEPGIGSFDVRVTPEQLTQLGDLGIPFQVVIADVQALVDSERESIVRAAQAANGDWFQSYKQYSEINDRLDFLGQTYPDLTQTSTIGQSLEGRDIRMIRVTGPDAEGNPRDGRPAFVIDGTQHAREWISPMTVMFAVDRLLSQYDADPRTRAVLDAVDFYFVPATNPDGYDFTWTDDRFWRKNRRINDRPNCPGVDLNRNWNVGWGGNGSSGDPCSDVYHGPAAWSEPEVLAVRDLTQSLSARLGAYLDFHSFGDLVLSPWMYTLNPPPDADRLNSYGQLMSDAIFGVHGVRYQSGQGSRILYIAAGTAHDWAYGELGAPAWGIELRGGGGGFVLEPAQIIPTGEENLEAILRLCESLLMGT
ncbi:MAG TPA: M14 family metallopeptidase [Myxococcaceae bacterium]|nr:M14 family metallopeptidase [Myxococcaceae bacterium]